MKIQKATAVYTGGGIYLYYAGLDNGNWLLGNDDWFIVVNENPLANEKTYEDSDYCEWQEEHMVEQIPEEQYQKVLNSVLDVIFNGKTIKEYDNFSIGDLQDRYKAE